MTDIFISYISCLYLEWILYWYNSPLTTNEIFAILYDSNEVISNSDGDISNNEEDYSIDTYSI